MTSERSSREGLPPGAVRLLELLDSLEVPVAFERSFKIMPGVLLTGRLLTGIRLEALPPSSRRARIENLCRRIGMPQTRLESLLEGLAGADNLLLGFEEGEGSALYKAYLEYTRRFVEIAEGRRSIDESFLLHQGFKWDPGAPDRSIAATYTCYPGFQPEQIYRRLARQHFARSPRGFALAVDVLEAALARELTHPFLYMEVAEQDNSRRSFDVNMYGARMKLHELGRILQKMFERFGVGMDSLESLMKAHGDLAFGHLSGGTDRRGRSFFTVYYGDPRAFMS